MSPRKNLRFTYQYNEQPNGINSQHLLQQRSFTPAQAASYLSPVILLAGPLTGGPLKTGITGKVRSSQLF